MSEAIAARLVSGMVEFSCFKCGKLLRINQQIIGQQAQCPGCRGIITVPAPTSAAQPATDFSTVAAPPPTANKPTNIFDPSQFNAPTTKPAPFVPRNLPQEAAPQNFSPPPVRTAPAVVNQGPLPDLALPSSFTLAPPANSILNQIGQGGDMTRTKALFEKILVELRKVYVGQDELILGTLIALFSHGHVLIESVPGLGKTLFVRTLGRILGCQFGRIQFTADLMPSDITGSLIFDMKSQEFRFHPGPVFTQILLADEINRSPAKTHAALLEIMQEYRVTVERNTHKLERPFLVLATQNPIESEGTYNLPEAQLDRFMFKLTVDYPTAEQELQVLMLHGQQMDVDHLLQNEVQTVTTPQEINELTKEHVNVRVDAQLLQYINKIVRLTREWPQFYMGASPRAGLALVQGARTLAAFYGRDYAVPDDVMQIVLPVLRHRVVLTAEADVEGHKVDQQLRELLRTVEVPRT
jgi:MoxR-like ATPase